MDNNDFSNDSSTQQYRATSNLNTAIENPEFNVNNAIGINIQTDNKDSGSLVESRDISDVPVDDQKIYQSNILNQQINHTNYDVDVSPVLSQSSYQDDSNDSVFEQSNSFVPDSSLTSNEVNVSYEPVSDSNSYEPVMENNKKNSGITISRDLKLFIFIVFILVIFVLLLPYIYDFFKGLKFIMAR